MAGYILILAILILGGAIATVGDRIGSRVGKARLSLFNLRPKKTAVLVTIITGSIISATTLGILFATSQELRDGVFRLAEIKKQQRQVKTELAQARQQRDQIQADLSQTRQELTKAQSRLNTVKESLTQAIQRQQQTQAQLDQVQTRFLQAQADLKNLSSDIQRLETEASQLQAERQRLIAQRNQVQGRLQQAENRLQQAARQQTQLEQAVKQAQANLQAVKSQRDQLEQSVKQAKIEADQAQANLKQAQEQRNQLLAQQSQLQEEIASLESSQTRLERDFTALTLGLRSRNVAIRPGQVLAVGTVREINNPDLGSQAIDQLLREANRTAIRLTKISQGDPNQQVVQITKTDRQQLIEQIETGRSYVIRLLAALNVVEGEASVLVIPQVVPNQVVFPAGEQVAAVSLDLPQMSDDQILGRLDSLFADSNQRAIQSGLLRDPLTGAVGSFSQADLIKFILQLREYEGRIKVATIVPEAVYTAGPLKLKLVAFRDQEVILESD